MWAPLLPMSALVIFGKAEIKDCGNEKEGNTPRWQSQISGTLLWWGGGTPFLALAGELDRSAHCLLVGVTLFAFHATF